MTKSSVRQVWCDADHPWSLWVKRPLFAALSVQEVAAVTDGRSYQSSSDAWSPEALPWPAGERVAVFVDLPGRDAVDVALSLGSRGFRPVLSINACSSHEEVIDMRGVLDLLVEGASFTSSFPSGPEVLPAFILDSRRDRASRYVAPGRFDNRWTLFATDLPSPKHLEKANITSVVIIQNSTWVNLDLLTIAAGYQRAGFEVRVASLHEHTTSRLREPRQGTLFSLARQLWRTFALRRRWDGSFGHRVPFPPEPSHG